MRRTLFLLGCLIFLPLGNRASAQPAYLTFKVKTSYASSLTVQAKAGLSSHGQTVWTSPIQANTTKTSRLDTKGLTSFQVQDANYVIDLWPQLEPGDSVAYEIDLDSGTATQTYDKRGFITIASNANRLYWLYQRRADSASWVLPFAAYRSYTREIEREFLDAITPVVDSLKSSAFYSNWKGYLTDFRFKQLRSYLRRPWKPTTLEILTKPASISDYLPVGRLPDEQMARAYTDWLQIIIAENTAKAAGKSADSLQRIFISSLKGRERSLAALQYVISGVAYSTDQQLTKLDSLASSWITDSDLKQEARAVLDARLSLSVGHPAPDIELPDSIGVLRKLSSFRGHYVLLDFWGTWCGPCLEQLPHLDSLAEHFAGSDLKIISVALEYKKVVGWKRFICEHQLPGTHLYAEAQFNNDQVKRFGIDRSGVPAYYLLDPEGQIVMSNTLRPSNPKLWKLLEDLLGTN